MPKPERTIRPRWKIVPRVVEDRVLDDGFEDEVAPAVVSFIQDLENEGLPAPEPQRVVDRVRHILRHSPEGQEIVLVAKGTPPYFGVTTKLAETVTRREGERKS